MVRETQTGPVDRTSQVHDNGEIVSAPDRRSSNLPQDQPIIDYGFKIDYVKVEPVGGVGGSPWDDGTHNGIREIMIYGGSDCVQSISVVYDKNGGPIVAGRHGSESGSKNQIVLRYPEEYLVNVSGHHGTTSGVRTPVIKSLTLKSNIRTFGPYGRQDGTAFTLPTQGGRIVGFMGRNGTVLDSIGCHIRHITPRRLM